MPKIHPPLFSLVISSDTHSLNIEEIKEAWHCFILESNNGHRFSLRVQIENFCKMYNLDQHHFSTLINHETGEIKYHDKQQPSENPRIEEYINSYLNVHASSPIFDRIESLIDSEQDLSTDECPSANHALMTHTCKPSRINAGPQENQESDINMLHRMA